MPYRDRVVVNNPKAMRARNRHASRTHEAPVRDTKAVKCRNPGNPAIQVLKGMQVVIAYHEDGPDGVRIKVPYAAIVVGLVGSPDLDLPGI